MLQQQMILRFVLHNIVARTTIVQVSWIVQTDAIPTDLCAVVRYLPPNLPIPQKISEGFIDRRGFVAECKRHTGLLHTNTTVSSTLSMTKHDIFISVRQWTDFYFLLNYQYDEAIFFSNFIGKKTFSDKSDRLPQKIFFQNVFCTICFTNEKWKFNSIMK